MEKLDESTDYKVNWITIERPGYFGNKRDEIQELWNNTYGEVGWRLVWQWGNNILERKDAMQIYEDAYYLHLKNHSSILDWLISTASDVYDTHKNNVEAGLEYKIDDTPSNHIHDIAIRRSVMRLGKTFCGDHLMHVRWTGSEGYVLNPGVVPFHMPEMINTEPISNYNGKSQWWLNGTIEDFYQKNKLLQVKD